VFAKEVEDPESLSDDLGTWRVWSERRKAIIGCGITNAIAGEDDNLE
jgi:hypothetical protein